MAVGKAGEALALVETHGFRVVLKNALDGQEVAGERRRGFPSSVIGLAEADLNKNQLIEINYKCRLIISIDSRNFNNNTLT